MGLNRHRAGSGPPLVLLHGLGSQWQMWRPVLDRLAAERDVLALDLPGFGLSGPSAVPPTIPALAAAVEEAVREEGLERPHVAGNSMGGVIALEMGARGTARSVCCLAPTGFERGREPVYQAAVLRATHAAARVLAPVADTALRPAAARTLALGHLAGRPWRIPPAEAAQAVRALAGAPGFAPTLPVVLRHPAALPAREVPVTIAWGARDVLLPPLRKAPAARARIPGARHLLLPGCGHVPTWDDPHLVAGVLLTASA